MLKYLLNLWICQSFMYLSIISRWALLNFTKFMPTKRMNRDVAYIPSVPQLLL